MIAGEGKILAAVVFNSLTNNRTEHVFTGELCTQRMEGRR